MQILSRSFFWCCLLAGYLLQAQNVPVGTWRTHTSFRSLQSVAVAGTHIYGGTNGGLFFLDQGYGNTTVLSRVDGLGGTNVGRLSYAAEQRTLIIAYADGKVDLWQDNRITPVTALAQANLPESKRISHISVAGSIAWLSGDFGVLVIDLLNKNIRETYRNIGPGGTQVSVRASAATGGMLYLATSQGIRRGRLDGTNLQDFRNWSAVEVPAGASLQALRAVTAQGGKLFAAYEDNGLFVLENDTWRKLPLPVVNSINALTASGEQVILCLPGELQIIAPDGSIRRVTSPAIINPQEAAFDGEGKLWIADAVNGLVSNWEGSFRSYSPAGPPGNRISRVGYANEQVVALPGRFLSDYRPAGDTTGFGLFNATGWQHYVSGLPAARLLPDAKDLMRSAYNPVDRTWYFGSFGGGLLAMQPDGVFVVYNEGNSPLRGSAGGGVKVTGLAADNDGNTWVALYGVALGEPSLHVRRRDGSWQSFSFTNIAARYPLDLVMDGSGNKWLSLAPEFGGGIWVFDDKGNRSRYLTSAIGNGGLPNPNVRSLAIDREGQMWAGTDRGAAVFPVPGDVLRGMPVDAITPIYERRALLRDEAVTAVAVDGGNRKWFGTRSGVFLFNATTDKLVNHFTVANSPLPSDSVAHLAIHSGTGEVFMATASGLVSYRGTATAAEADPAGVKIFPNPVRPGFGGLVGISGLPEDAVVKITDVSGRLVYETRAQGGSAVWNVQDYRGRRAATGIYLIYTSDAAGSQLLVGKMAVIE